MDLRETLNTVRGFLRDISAPTPDVPKPLEHPDRLGGQVVAVRKDYKLQTLDGPQHGRRLHTFTDPKSFAAWLNRHATDPEKVEIAIGESTAEAILGPRDLDADRIAYAMLLHPTFERWQDALGEQLSQRRFMELVRGDRVSVGSADQILANLGVLKVASRGSVESRIDETGATRFSGGSSGTEVEGTIPATLDLSTPVFQGVERLDDDGKIVAGQWAHYALEFLISVDFTERGQPIFSLSCPALDLVVLEARRDLAFYLNELLDGGRFLVGLGVLKVDAAPEFEGDQPDDDD